MFGIDVSAGQVGMDFAKAKSEGVEFVIVKAVAAYRPEHTVAEGYARNIDDVFAAGIAGRGHYAIPNSRNTPEVLAAFMAANLHRYTLGQVLALDNEPLDSYPTFWKDAEAARFFRKLHELTSCPYRQMWLYCPAALTRQHGPWPECEALGVRFWWAAYGGSPTGQTPDHEPALKGSLSHWDVHQYTSRAAVAGRSVDGNYTPLAVGELFGGDMAFNPFQNMRITGTWEDHASYSAGGTDLPTAYGTTIRAPAAGTLQISGGSGEWACGWVGSAGRRSILRLDTPIGRKLPRRPRPPEGDGPMVAIVFQHQSAFGTAGHHGIGTPVGKTGASANGSEHGGDVHLHWHGLNAQGQRLRLESYITDGSLAEPAPSTPKEDIVARYHWAPNRGGMLITEADGVFWPLPGDLALYAEYQTVQSKSFNGMDIGTREWDVARQDAFDRAATVGKKFEEGINKTINDAFAQIAGGFGESTITADDLAKALIDNGFEAVKPEWDPKELAEAILSEAGRRLSDTEPAPEPAPES